MPPSPKRQAELAQRMNERLSQNVRSAIERAEAKQSVAGRLWPNLIPKPDQPKEKK